MKTKIYYLLLLCLMVLGRGEVWADATYTIDFNGQPTQSNTGYFTLSGRLEYSTKFNSATYANITFSKGLKMQAAEINNSVVINPATTISFSNNQTATVTIVQSIWSNQPIKLDDTQYGITNTISENGCYIYVIPNVSAGTHSITRGGSEIGLFYIKVVEDGKTYSGPDYTVQSYPYTWNFKTMQANESEFMSYSGDWTPGNNHVYTQSFPSSVYSDLSTVGFNITPLKGLRFAKTGTISPDCSSWNYLYLQGSPSITIPSLSEGQVITISGTFRDDINSAASADITATNTTVSSITAEKSSEAHNYTFYVSTNGDVTLSFGSGAWSMYSIAVTEKPEPSLSFENGTSVNVRIPYGETSTTYSNSLVTPADFEGTVAYSIVSGSSTVNNSTGLVTIPGAGTIVVRATASGDPKYRTKYIDYTINATTTDFTVFNSSNITYEWRFNEVSWWVTTGSEFDTSSQKWWQDTNNDNIWKWGNNHTNLSNTTLYTTGSAILPETNNLTFTSVFNRVGVKIGSYLWLNTDAKVTLPSLPAGTKVIVQARMKDGSGTLTPSNATDLTAQDVSSTATNYEFTVAATGTVDLTNGNGEMFIYAIKIEKASTSFTKNAVSGTTFTYSTTPTIINVIGTFSPAIIGSGVSANDFEAVSSDEDIITFSTIADGTAYYVNTTDNDKVNFIRLKTGTKAGTAVVTFRFKGNQYYNPSSFDVVFVVSKADPLFDYQNKNVEVAFEEAYGVSVSNTLNKSSNLTESKISYTSNDTHVAEVSSSGEVTIKNAGTAVIRATFAGDDNYEATETAYTLNVTGTASSETLSWVSTVNGSFPTTPAGGVSFKLGDSDLTYPATCSPSSTVNYKSSDSDIVTVDDNGKIHAAHPGTATVWAYTDGNGNQRGAELSYTVTVNGGNLSLGFDPTAGTVNVGCIIMPRLMLPSLEKGDIELLSMESSDPTVATVPTSTPAPSKGTTNLLENDYLKMAATRIDNVYPPIKGESVGEAEITVYFKSPYYNNGDVSSTTYTVTVTDKLDNFNWANNSRHSYTLVEGEFMMMPAISGNANGNITGLSNGKVNKSTEGGYVYSITGASRTIKLNDKDWKYGQGVPNFTLTPTSVGGGKAYIFWIVGGDESHPALAIYAEQAGDLILRATDSQTGWHCDDITLHVVSKDQRQKQVEQDFWADKKFPFTWDFSNVSSNSIVDDEVHWKTNKFDGFDNPVGGHAAATGEHILGMASSFGYDYADEQDPDKKTSITEGNNRAKSIWKYISNGEGENCRIMPEFEGLRIGIGTNSFGRYIHKKDRASLHDANSSDPRFQFIGGDHYLYLPEMPAVKTPGSYKLIMKLGGGTYSYKDGNIDKGNSSHVTVELIGDDGVELSPRQYIGEAETVIGLNKEKNIEIVSFDISSENAGKALRLALNNASVYWIAFSTEERIATKKANITSYAAATYCYNEDLDLAKSVEANSGTKVYRASNFNSETSTVTLTPITDCVPASTGLVLKSAETSSNYMIATGRNTDSYSKPQDLVPVAEGDKLINLLKPAPVGTVVTRFVNSSGVGTADMSSEDIAFTNFVLTSSYKKVDENGNAISGYQNSDWMYYRVNATTTSTNNMSYLQLPNKLREIGVDGARKAVDGTQDYKLSNLINIVFEDELQSEVSGINVKQITPSLNVNDAWYTLQGVRVDKPAKGGVYIQRGRKVILK